MLKISVVYFMWNPEICQDPPTCGQDDLVLLLYCQKLTCKRFMAWVNLFKNPLNITPLLISSWSDTIRNALQFGRARCQRRETTHQQHKTDLIWTCSPSGGHTEKGKKNILKIYLVKGTIFTTCKKNCTIKIWNF